MGRAGPCSQFLWPGSASSPRRDPRTRSPPQRPQDAQAFIFKVPPGERTSGDLSAARPGASGAAWSCRTPTSARMPREPGSSPTKPGPRVDPPRAAAGPQGACVCEGGEGEGQGRGAEPRKGELRKRDVTAGSERTRLRPRRLLPATGLRRASTRSPSDTRGHTGGPRGALPCSRERGLAGGSGARRRNTTWSPGHHVPSPATRVCVRARV